MKGTIKVLHGDITRIQADVIVNAANETLLGGGGVDGAIHRAAGPELLEECRTLGGCPTGQVRVTSAYRLRARSVFHTAGPIWKGGNHGEPEKLASCYRESLQIACRMGYRSIAFPSISTGVYGYPVDLAAPVALHTILDFLNIENQDLEVLLICFDEATMGIYNKHLKLLWTEK